MSTFLQIASCAISLAFLLIACTDRIESTLPPAATPPQRIEGEVPLHLKALFSSHCAACHGEKEGVKSIYLAPSRSPKNWIGFLKNHPLKQDKTATTITLNETEYAALGEWLARVCKDNQPVNRPD
jgi:mono/diheme cytochrome c family protein